MKVQFYFGCNEDPTVEIFVTEAPTEEQCKAIEDCIYDEIEKWENEDEDYYDFEVGDYYGVCYEAVSRHLMLENNPVVKAFYF